MILLKDLLSEISKEEAALEFLSKLVSDGPFRGRVFLAGGAVRDLELNKSPKDLDVVVTGGINSGIDFANWATKKIGKMTGKNIHEPIIFQTYGTAKFILQGVVYNGHDLSDVDVEAVAPRKEKYTPGSRKPEVSGGELKDDVQRRDFTINSLLKDLTTGEILDLTGMGRNDIKSGIVRTPLDPDVIFSEDALRLLRCVRFTAKYNWKLPMFMIRAIKKNASQLTNISKERIHDETNKMVLTNYPFKAFRLLQILGLMKYVFPSLQSADLEHMKKMKNCIPDLTVRLVAALQHVNPSKVQSEMTNLRYSLDVTKPVTATLATLPTFLSRAENLSDEYLRELAYTSPNVVTYLFNYASVYVENFNVYEAEERYGELQDQLKQNPLPITGDDLVALGMKPSPEFKKILDTAKRMYIKNPLTPKAEYLKLVKVPMAEEVKKNLGYKEFLARDQQIYRDGITYDKYVNAMSKLVGNDADSGWLFNHHAAGLALGESMMDKAKIHIAKAVEHNPFDNSITNALDFVINKRGSQKDYAKFVEAHVGPKERRAATVVGRYLKP